MLITNATGRSGPDPRTFARVKRTILSLRPIGVGEAMDTSSHLIDEVGLDSLKLVDLTVALERELCLAEFPMQQWVDALIEAGEPLTVGALVTACDELLSEARRA